MPKSRAQEQRERETIRDYVNGLKDLADLNTAPAIFAGLSCWVYKSIAAPGLSGWIWPGDGLTDHTQPNSPVPPPPKVSGGYDGGAFYHETSKTLILANRGTETERDWVDNITTLFGLSSTQMKDAVSFAVAAVLQVRKERGSLDKVIVTGHSLGGGLAGAQYACLNAALQAANEAPVGNLDGYCTASAPFGAEALRRLQNTYHQSAQPSDPAFSRLRNYIRPGDPIRRSVLPGTYVLGYIDEELPEVWAFWPRPPSAGGHPSAKWALNSFRAQSHSAYRYFQYFGARPDDCVVVNHRDEELVLSGRRRPPDPHRFNDPNARWANLKALPSL